MELTREKAKELFSKCKSDFIIDKIYDSLQNRNCKNCKFGMTYHFDDEVECFKIEADTQGMYFSNDFCCNKWEKK